MMISDKLLEVAQTLSCWHEDLFMCDKERSYSACKYKFVLDPFDYTKSTKYLVETLHFRRMYWKDVYLGIGLKTDKRFDNNGQYIDDQL